MQGWTEFYSFLARSVKCYLLILAAKLNPALSVAPVENRDTTKRPYDNQTAHHFETFSPWGLHKFLQLIHLLRDFK